MKYSKELHDQLREFVSNESENCVGWVADNKVAALLDEIDSLNAEVDAEQKAHDVIARICFAHGVDTNDGSSVSAVKNLAALVDRLHAERRWIPVSQPPENEQDVLLYLHSGYVRIGAIDEDGEWFDIFCEPLIKVTHWQPLPPAPESEGE